MHDKWRHYAGRLIDIFVVSFVPKSTRLRLQYMKYVWLFGWEPEIKHIKGYARSGDLAIDIGANFGLWSYAMVKSGMFGKVLAFEPNPSLTGDLQNAGFENLTVMHKAVSNVAGTSCLRIPKQGN